MKKSKLLSLTLTLALVFTTVFAGTESIFAAERNAAPMTKAAVMQALEDTDTTGAPGSETNPVVAVNANSSTTAKTWGVQYSSTDPMVLAVEIPKAGTFEFNLMADAYSTVALYDSLEATAPIGYQNVPAASSNDDYKSLYVQAKKAGIYYLAFTTNSSATVQAAFNAYYAPAGNATPTKGKTYNAASLSSTKYYYYKVKTTKTGYLTIEFPWGTNGDSSSYSVKLMNSSKKKNLYNGVTKVNSGKNYVTYAGVPKGTYYVAVKTTDAMYGIKISAKYPTEKSGTSKAKAKSIMKGSTKKGIITATQSRSSADWYKIKVNSNQKVYLDVLTRTGGYSGGIRVTVYSTKKTMGSSDFYNSNDPESYAGSLELYTTINGVRVGYLQKGTYYVKVSKYGSGSGYYELKWR